jgi:hypothetical protein
MTSLAGVGGILTSLGAIAAGLSKGQFDPSQFTGLITGIGLLLAKDFNVTGGSVKQ